ncbi:MAG: hypothetical protein AAF490_05345 [Chloroflexota bacterium]
MLSNLPEILALINDTLQAIIVAFGIGVVLFTLTEGFRDQVTAAFVSVLTFVSIVYFTELMASRIIDALSAETWLRAQWVGIAFVPAAQFHLSDTLLSITGAPPKRRRFLTPITYLIGVVFLSLVLFSNLVVQEIVNESAVPYLTAGSVFPLFVIYFWFVTAASIYNVWRARQRCLTRTTRNRMSSTLVAITAAPLGVFPYLLLSGNSISGDIPIWIWPIIIVGNLVVGAMFTVLTVQVTYLSATKPDRVVWSRLVKFMARVPMSGAIVLLVYIYVSRTDGILGMPVETLIGFSMVLTVMLIQWWIHIYKRPLSRLFQLEEDIEVRRIQELSERLLTTREVQQFLESLMAITCETLRTPTSFVAAITSDGPKLESVVGPLTYDGTELPNPDWRALSQSETASQGPELFFEEGLFIWQGFWIRPLYDRDSKVVIGIMGIRARSGTPDLTEGEALIFERLADQAASALEDRLLQQEVFAAVGGLLPQITALQARNQAAKFGDLSNLTDTTQHDELLDDPDFNSMVRDALTHYWGGPKLTKSPLMRLEVVRKAMDENENNPTKALRSILDKAIALQMPEGERKMTTAEWILYNILELKFVQGLRVRDIARRLAMSESDLYRKQRVAIENVAQSIATMEKETVSNSA